MSESILRAPSHVPAELVYDFDIYASLGEGDWSHEAFAQRLYGEAPRIFYTLRNGGHWVVTRLADATSVLRNPALFSSENEFNRWRGSSLKLLPLYYDPPELGHARRILMPFLAPAAVGSMELYMRSLAGKLIDTVLDKGGCEFIADIAHRYPVGIFFHMVDGPEAAREELIGLVHRYLRAPEQAEREANFAKLTAFLTRLVEERRARPGEDMLSRMLVSTFDGRDLTPEECTGAVVNLFLAGLDTVASMTTFIMRRLASNPADYAKLVANPSAIPGAVEELIRISAVAAAQRGVREDCELDGVALKKFDRIVVLLQMMGYDSEQNEDPGRVDFSRGVSRHVAFGSGPHRCLGSHLGRTEIKILLEEWVKRVPAFRVADGARVQIEGGSVWVPASMPLVWNAASAGQTH